MNIPVVACLSAMTYSKVLTTRMTTGAKGSGSNKDRVTTDGRQLEAKFGVAYYTCKAPCAAVPAF